jgi:hypothetical protein
MEYNVNFDFNISLKSEEAVTEVRTKIAQILADYNCDNYRYSQYTRKEEKYCGGCPAQGIELTEKSI